MTRIALIGMGLIGTSLGLALRGASESALGARTLVGYDADPRSTRIARERQAIDHAARSLEEALHGAQLVVLAVPALALRDMLAQMAPLLPAGSVVTDVTSTKANVCAWASELLPPEVAFVGGHPMAGREQSGPTAADPELFRGAIYCLTPGPDTPRHAVDLVEALVATVGARPYYLDPAEHDAYVAGVSHLPFVLSAALVDVTSRSPAWSDMAALAATGFRDISRLASGDPAMHRDICLTNRDALLRWIDDMRDLLDDYHTALEQEDAARLQAIFERAREVREAWLASRPGLRPGEERLAMPEVDPPLSRLLGRWRRKDKP
jgi:prephenate dehydrogenase